MFIYWYMCMPLILFFYTMLCACDFLCMYMYVPNRVSECTDLIAWFMTQYIVYIYRWSMMKYMCVCVFAGE